jgi:hypothetical protein
MDNNIRTVGMTLRTRWDPLEKRGYNDRRRGRELKASTFGVCL